MMSLAHRLCTGNASNSAGLGSNLKELLLRQEDIAFFVLFFFSLVDTIQPTCSLLFSSLQRLGLVFRIVAYKFRFNLGFS